MKHQKHTKLTKKINGNIAPQEVAILGASCNIITKLVQDVSLKLKEKFKIAYIDASHAEEVKNLTFDRYTFHSSGSLNIEKSTSINKYNNKVRFNQYDLSFINGNHYQAEKQIIILDAEKENSILKRIDQINDVLCFILKDERTVVFDCLKEKFGNVKNIPVYSLNDIPKISSLVEKEFTKTKPLLDGLVLIGGKSLRMGSNKAKLSYYGKDHSIYLADLLSEKMTKTYLSVKEISDYEFPQIVDRFLDLGPFGAICSAFLNNPNRAYFVLATDLPFINKDLIDLLILNRDTSKIGTTVKGMSKEFPEPLITIWEPRAYSVLLNHLAQGISCPRKVLINSDVKIIEVADKFITNVNTPEDFNQAVKII